MYKRQERFRVEISEIKAVLVNLNTTVIGARPRFPIEQLLDSRERAETVAAAASGERSIFADGQWHKTRVYRREALPIGAEITGPAVIEQTDATTVIEPGARAYVDEIGNLRIRVEASA